MRNMKTVFIKRKRTWTCGWESLPKHRTKNNPTFEPAI